ncbi:MAG: penicillin acylase family protein [Cryomorphaceae bacterium]|jgi:penicillin amidase|nr:penicillin acylase family protein [Cryomorphaceae bacterium]MBT7019294.1 penicillin acylase family protein [Cryomorphaceae bacterium]MBT7546255.1 penicillin acylase family protein [Cryomorphaceae bacterium]
MKKLFIIILAVTLYSCVNSAKIDGLTDEVEVLRDNFGINHIYANNQQDLFFMQGYLAAKDRLFQFEIWRRQATGTVAEIFGAEELDRDIGTRLFKFRGDIKKELNHYHDDGYEIVSSFVSGVNKYIEEVNNNPELLPIEFKALGIKPDLWTNEVVISRHQGLLGNIGQELNIGRAVSLIGEEKVKELMWFHPKEPSLKLDEKITYDDLNQDILRLYNAYRRPIKFKSHYVLDKYRAKDKIADINESNLISDTYSIGSNNWALSGDKSFNGYPLLANDPHRSLLNPSLRYMAHLVAPGWNVIGGGEPEIPGISIGHNGIGAWGLTVFRTDAEDLYVYELNPNNLDEYMHNGQWKKFDNINETITVKNNDETTVELLYSVHGPVTFIDRNRKKAYAVKNGWSEIGGSPYLASLRMDQAKDWNEFRDACTYFNIPGENMVWADKYGDIGWQAVGIAPIRKTHSGLVPVNGNGKFDWEGYLPIIEKPNSFNPENGYLSTANQNVTPDTYNRWDAVGYDWADPYRGNRIKSVIESKEKFNMEEMIDLQVDYYSIPSEEIIRLASGNISNHQNYFEKLEKWNNILDKDSVEAGIYIEWQTQIYVEFINSFVPESVKEYLDIQIFRIIETISKMSDSNRAKFLDKTFNASIDNLKDRYGEDSENWIYGQQDYKHVKIYHPLENVVNDSIRSLVELKTYPRGGDGFTPGSTSSNLNQRSGGSFRVVINTKDWDNSFATNSPGQSGNPNSKFYKNLYEDWTNDKFFPLLFSKSKVLMNLSSRKVYRPIN